MKVDLTIGTDLHSAPAEAREAEDIGYDGIWSMEAAHDPFLPLLLAAEHTERLEIGTSIAVALARNPMTVANLGYDLQSFSGGRVTLGIGSQVKAHIERRFSMPWSRPVSQMREFILAMRAIWESWETGDRLDFQGDFYSHTLMTPLFSPGPNPHGRPQVLLAAVGNNMTEAAGEVADGMVVHPFTTARYLKEVTLPALERGLAKAGRARGELALSQPVFLITGVDDQAMVKAEASVKQQIAFYGSTPAYRPVLDLHGWGELHEELNRLSKTGDWEAMGALIDDDVLSTFALTGTPSELGALIHERFDGLIDRATLFTPRQPVGPHLAPIVEDLHRRAGA